MPSKGTVLYLGADRARIPGYIVRFAAERSLTLRLVGGSRELRRALKARDEAGIEESADSCRWPLGRPWPVMAVLDVRAGTPLASLAELCRRVKADPLTATVPVVIIGDEDPGVGDGGGSAVRALEAGADEVIGEGMGAREKELRIALLLRRSRRDLSANPATRLPGGEEVRRQTQAWLGRSGSFAAGYADLDRFKAFNDTCGYAEGDRVIVRLGGILRDAVGRAAPGGFVGHIGGDDFVFLVAADRAAACCAEAVRAFANAFPASDGRPGLALSIGVATTSGRDLASPEEVGRLAAEMKSRAKRIRGTTFVIDGVAASSGTLRPDAPDARGSFGAPPREPVRSPSARWSR